MSNPVITATTPTMPPPVTSFDRFWLGIQSLPADPNSPIPITITLRRYGIGTDNKAYFDPTGRPVVFTVPDLSAEMTANPLVETAFSNVITAAASMAQVRGLI